MAAAPLRVAVKTVVLRRNRRALCKRRQSCEFLRLNAHAAEFDEAVKEYGELVELPSKFRNGNVRKLQNVLAALAVRQGGAGGADADPQFRVRFDREARAICTGDTPCGQAGTTEGRGDNEMRRWDPLIGRIEMYVLLGVAVLLAVAYGVRRVVEVTRTF
jgi:hypothetical protein